MLRPSKEKLYCPLRRSLSSNPPYAAFLFRSAAQAADERLDRIEALAGKLGLPRAALEGSASVPILPTTTPATVPFSDPDPFRELRFPSILAAKLAVADYLGRPLAKLAAEDLGYIEALLKETLERRTIITCVRGYFRNRTQRRQEEDGEHAR